MLQTTFARVRDEDMPRLRSWLAALSSRREELRDSYRQQGTRHELFFLLPTRRSSILVLVSEVDDAEQAASSFLRSELPIDVEFKTLFQGISPEEADVELLYDSAEYLGIAAA
jgi:hypothetical protein